MRTTKHMPWYGTAQTERFESRVPSGMKKDLARLIAYRKGTRRKITSATDFIISQVSQAIAKEILEIERFEKQTRPRLKHYTAKEKAKA